MKRILILVSCALIGAQLPILSHSQAACEQSPSCQNCGQQLLNDFDPEWQRWNQGYCGSCGAYNQNCQEDSSEFANQLEFK